MSSNFSDDLKKVLYAGVGAVAATLEKVGEVVDQCIKKGEMTVEQGRAFNSELKHKVEEVMSSHTDVNAMTAEERAELRRQLDELDDKERQNHADEFACGNCDTCEETDCSLRTEKGCGPGCCEG